LSSIARPRLFSKVFALGWSKIGQAPDIGAHGGLPVAARRGGRGISGEIRWTKALAVTGSAGAGRNLWHRRDVRCGCCSIGEVPDVAAIASARCRAAIVAVASRIYCGHGASWTALAIVILAHRRESESDECLYVGFWWPRRGEDDSIQEG
jgi:hypothetical protein